jgi:hypothetical protein
VFGQGGHAGAAGDGPISIQALDDRRRRDGKPAAPLASPRAARIAAERAETVGLHQRELAARASVK